MVKKLSLLNIGFVALIVKAIALPDIATAIGLVALSAAYAFQSFLDKRETDRFDDISAELKELKEKDIAELKSALTALKINQGIKKVNEQPGQSQQPKRFF